MAQIINLQSTNTLGSDDQAILRQGTIDKRVSLELAGTLSWAKRNGYTHLGEHTTGLVFPDLKSFSTLQGVVYFVKGSTSLPYTSLSNTPATEPGLRKYEESTGNGANLLSNPNFLTPSTLVVNSTPQDVLTGVEIFSGVIAGSSGIQGLTYIDGHVNFSGGDFYIPRTNSKELENITEFVASVADFDGKPRARGVSYALVGSEYRVTVGVDALEDAATNPTPLGSVKFEQGSIATVHEVGSLSVGDLPEYTKISFKPRAGKSAVENMVLGFPVELSDGDKCNTGGTDWYANTTIGLPLDNGLFAFPEARVLINDFGVTGDYNTTTQTGTNNRPAFDAAVSLMKKTGGGILEVKGDEFGGDYLLDNSWNITTSNTHLVVHPDATIRVNAVTSKGHTLAFISQYSVTNPGEYGVESIENVSICGGGKVIAQDLGGGTNENSIGFVDVSNFICANMNLPESNRKAITAQNNVQNGWIYNNNIGKTFGDAITIQGSFDPTYANLPVENVWVYDNVIEETDGRGVYATGLESLVARDIHFLRNIVRSCGIVGVEMRDILRPEARGNYSVGGAAGVIFRDCNEITGDVNCDFVTSFALHILTFNDSNAKGFDIDKVVVGGSCGQDVVRITDVKGGGSFGRIKTRTTDHEYIYRVVGSSQSDKVTVVEGLIGTDGTLGRVSVGQTAFHPWLPISVVDTPNGVATRYPDGTLICTRSVDYDFSTANNVAYTYPDTFIDAPNGAKSFQGTTISDRINAYIGTEVMCSSSEWRLANNVATLETLQVNLTATGRWRGIASWDK